MVRYILFRLLRMVGLLFMLPLIVALIYREYDSALVFLALAAASLIFGYIGSRKRPTNRVIYAKEGFAVTAVAWFVMSLMGALPFTITGTIPSYVDALFETVSGLTTTGGSILTTLEGVEYSVQFWRTFTHWIGGMGAEEQLRKAAKSAVCKINIDSDSRLAMTAAVRKAFAEKPAEFDPRKYLGPARDHMKELYMHKIVNVLGSNGKLAL